MAEEIQKPAENVDAPKPADAPKPVEPAANAAKPADVKQEPPKPEVKPENSQKPDEVKPPADDKKTADAKPAEGKPDDKTAQSPEKYELKLSENSPLGEEWVKEIESYARENGLSNEEAQAILDREQDAAQAGVNHVMTKAKKQSDQWLKEAQADPEIGGDKFKETVFMANDALEKLFPGIEIRKFMDTSGFGNNPTVLKGFAQIGRMLNDPQIMKSSKQPPQKVPMTSKFYDHPTSPKS